MVIFNGKKEAEEILLELKKKIKKEKLRPKLAVISVGQNPASELFIRNKKRAARKIGIKIVHCKFRADIKEKKILKIIQNLNNNSSVDGIIVQLPLPKKFHPEKIIKEVELKKDVDGFRQKTIFQSPLISAISIALKSAAKNFSKKKIYALVNSDIFGKALKQTLKKERIKISYFKKRENHQIKSADILISVLGSPQLIKNKTIKEGAVLIDAGITLIGKKVAGDVDKKSVEKKASFLTPVPGGIGPLNIAYLLKNVYYAAERGEAERRLKMKGNSGRGKLHRLAKQYGNR